MLSSCSSLRQSARLRSEIRLTRRPGGSRRNAEYLLPAVAPYRHRPGCA